MQQSRFQNKYIEPTQILNNISVDDLDSVTCAICLGVVLDPAECKKCQKIFCSAEVMKQGSFQPCPFCKISSWKYGSEIHRMYRSRLSSLEVRCEVHPECKDKKYSYEKYISHLANDKLQKPVEKGYYQFYFEINGVWNPFQTKYNDLANVYIQQNYSQFILGKYLINVNISQQMNIDTKRKRLIKIELMKNKFPKAFWVVEVEGSKYQPYDDENNQYLQKSYQQFLQGRRKQATLKAGKYQYDIEFSTFKQVNFLSRTSRRIKRVMI